MKIANWIKKKFGSKTCTPNCVDKLLSKSDSIESKIIRELYTCNGYIEKNSSDRFNQLYFKIKDVEKILMEEYPKTLTPNNNDCLVEGTFINPDTIPNYATTDQMKQIVRLSKKSIAELRELNEYPAYNGKELTKYQLIFQIVFKSDCPKNF